MKKFKILKNLILVALIGSSTAQADPRFKCKDSKVGIIQIEFGQVKKFCATPDYPLFVSSEVEEDGGILGFLGLGERRSKTVFIAGRSAEGFIQTFQDNIPQLKDSLSDLVFPIVDEDENIVGSAFRYDGKTLTALHVVSTASLQKPLYVYDKNTDYKYRIEGYAPSKRDPDGINSISYFDDFCVLKVPHLESMDSFPISETPITKIFQYLELSYPRDNSALKDPSAFSSHIAHSKTDKEGVVLLNRSGQNFNSSGGPIVEVSSLKARALNICIENTTNAVKAIDIYRINEGIDAALAASFISSLAEIKYNFTYADKCPPIGGRGSGP